MKRLAIEALWPFICLCIITNCNMSANAETNTKGIEIVKNVFSITIPVGWVEIPRDIIDEYEASLVKKMPNAPKQHYECGFYPESTIGLTYPYLLIQLNNSGRIPQGEIESMAGYSPQKSVDKIDFGATITNAKAGEMIYEKDKNIIWSVGSVDIEGRGSITGLTGIMPTETGFILAVGASYSDDYSVNSKVFRDIILSIKPNLNLTYKTKISDKYPFLSRLSNPEVIGKVIGGLLLAGLFSLSSYLSKIKKQKELKKEACLPFYRDHFAGDRNVKSDVNVVHGGSIEGHFIKESKTTDKPLKFPCPVCNKLVVSSFCKKGDTIVCRKCNNRVEIPDTAEYIE